MMNTDLPTPNNPLYISQQRQISILSTDESVLSSNNVSDFFKSLTLRYKIEQVIKKNNAEAITTGVDIVDLQINRTLISSHQDTEHFAASINKLPVALLLLQDLRAGVLNMDQVMTWQPSDVRGGFGFYDQPGAPLQATLGEVIHDLLNRSGNTAVRILVNGALGGAASVNDRWSTMPELSHTYLQPLDYNRFYLGYSTPHDSLWSMQQLMTTQDAYSEFMKNSMATNIFTDNSVRSQLAGNDFVVLINKVGLLDDVDGNNRHDVGIIYNIKSHKSYGYSLMTTSPFDSTTATPRAEESLEDVGRYLLRYAGDKQHTSSLGTQKLRQLQPDSTKILY